ncbi:uncharacterized protein LOC126251774 [Schistocerca nitens]|uniref:uncharacterized protein LOC126251774 n=1 Tax=Schistocerca nitens TaxID=7011 RepID=UPI0021183E94|nr:uncharacterized protein LOC126251774 [Schistocerca nitens]
MRPTEQAPPTATPTAAIPPLRQFEVQEDEWIEGLQQFEAHVIAHNVPDSRIQRTARLQQPPGGIITTPHGDGAFAFSASSRPTDGAGPAHTAAVATCFIWFMASGGGRVPFWAFSEGRFRHSEVRMARYDRKLDVPCSHRFPSSVAPTLLPPALL